VNMRTLFCIGCLSMLLLPALGFSQAGSGQIQGDVLDPEGAAIPGANLIIKHVETGAERTMKSDESGRFSAPFMPVGTYEIRAEANGMAPLIRSGLMLTVGQTLQVSLNLVPAGVQAEVTVIGEAPLVLASQTDVASTLNSVAIENLPVNGRRWENFVLLTPGVTNDGTFGLVSFHGIAGTFNNTMVDGADNNQAFFSEERGRTRIAYTVSQETIREFQVKTSNYSAEFGRAAGGVVNAVTRSGTNEFHGSAFYYLRDRSFLARDPFARALNQPKPPERRHQFGGSVGGPISRDKVFFFLSYDQQNRNFPITVLPTSGETFFTGSTAPADATQQAVSFLRSLTGVFPRKANQYLPFGKVDWQISDAHSFSTSVNILKFDSPNGALTQNVIDRALSQNGKDAVRAETIINRLTSVLSPSLVNEVRFQYSRDFEFQEANGPGPSVIVGPTGNQLRYGMPDFLPRPAYPNEKRWQIADDFSVLRGAHDFKVGVDINFVRDLFSNIFRGGGVYTYPNLTAFVQDYARLDTGANTRKHYSTYIQAFDLTNPQGTHKFNTVDYNFYVQDSFRVTPSFTLNMGVRYEYQQIPQPETSNPLLPQTARLNKDKNNFGPRLGIAWQPIARTIFRAGYGLSYGRTQHSTLSNFTLNNGVTQPFFTLTPALAGSPTFPDVFSAPPAVTGASSIQLASPDLVNPEVHQASAELEHQVGNNLNFSARYMMARGTHLPFAHDMNIAPATQTRTYNVLDAAGGVERTITVPFYTTRLNTAFGPLISYETGVSSWYHAMVLQVNKRFSHDIQFMTNFTWAHATDDGQSSGNFVPGPALLDPYDRRAEYGNSFLDQRKRFVFSGLWQPGFEPASMAARALASGWKFGGIVTLADGFAQTGTVQLPGNIAGGLGTGLNGSGDTNNRFPGIGRNAYLRPGLSNVDLRVAREFAFAESNAVEFMVEGFNIFNRVNYASVNPTQYILSGTNLTPNPQFLRPTAALSYPSVGNPRQLQVALRYKF
jgi:hypothetical protein